MLTKWHGVQRSADGAVTGFWGLTLSKTKHRFRIGRRDLYTWCAWDTLFLPPLLDATAEVESACQANCKPITLRVSPRGVEAASPESVALSFVMPREADIERNVIETFCCHVHFFASAQAGKQWIARRTGTFLLSLSDGWQIGLRKNFAQYEATATLKSTS